jgi:excisionase family DNA binding protein
MDRSETAPNGATLGSEMEPTRSDFTRIRFLTFREAQSLLRTSASWLYKAVEGRRIPFTKIGNRIIFELDALQAWLKANTSTPKA